MRLGRNGCSNELAILEMTRARKRTRLCSSLSVTAVLSRAVSAWPRCTKREKGFLRSENAPPNYTKKPVAMAMLLGAKG
jgi:hypothetical protein